MDFANILGKLRTAKPMPPPAIDETTLFRKAQAMAGRGYRHSAESLEALQAYIQGYGVLLSGAIGIGKTFFFQSVEPEPLPILSFNSCTLWTFDKLEEWLMEHRSQQIVLDDIGWAESLSSNYGQRFESLQVALDYRVNCGARTHITTNLTNDELIEKYDAHLVDRIYQLCKCFKLPPCESMREASPNSTWIKNQSYARQMGKEVL